LLFAAFMTRAAAPAYIELNLDDDELDAADATTAALVDSWLDEKTVRFDFDKPVLTADDRLVIGYLTMEENDLFGGLSVEEQQRIARTLKR
jgi:hypothetical protein